MRELIVLIKTNLNVHFGFSILKYKFINQKKELWKPLLIGFALFSLIPSYVLYIKFIKGLYEGLSMLNQESSMLVLSFVVASMIIFIFGIMYVFSTYYFARDIDILLPLPIKPRNIVISKFITMMVSEYLILLPLIIPVVIIYGSSSGSGILYYIFWIIEMLFIPIIPLSIATIVVMLILRATNVKGKRDLIRTISLFLFLFLFLGLQMIITKATNQIAPGNEQEYMLQLLKNNNALLNQFGTSYPPAIWATKSLLEPSSIISIFNLVIYLVSSIGTFLLVVITGNYVYLKGIIGGQETTGKKKKLSKEKLQDKVKKVTHPALAVFKTDIRMLFRTPIYMFNCISTVVLLPFIFFIMPIFMGGGELNILKEYYIPYLNYFNLGISGFFVIFVAMNPISSTTFSREGKSFWISRIAPVKPEHQVLGRVISVLAVQIALIVFVILGINFIVPIEISTIIIPFVFGLLGSIPLIALGMIIDLKRPVLNWDNPQKAVKQNLNVLISMAIGLLYLGGLVLFTIFLLKSNISILLIYIILTIIFSVLSVIFLKILVSQIEDRFISIE